MGPHCLTQSFSNRVHKASGLCSLPCSAADRGIHRVINSNFPVSFATKRTIYYYYTGNLVRRWLQHTVIVLRVIRPPTRELRSLGLVPGVCVCLTALFQHQDTCRLRPPWHRTSDSGFVRHHVRATALLGNLVLTGEMSSLLSTGGKPEINPKELPRHHEGSWYGISKRTPTPRWTVLLGRRVPPGSEEGLSMVLSPILRSLQSLYGQSVMCSWLIYLPKSTLKCTKRGPLGKEGAKCLWSPWKDICISSACESPLC